MIISEDHVITNFIPQSIPIDGEVLHMGSVQGLPGTAGAHSTDNHRSDIVHTMGWRIFLLLYLAVCVHRYYGESNTCVASLCCHGYSYNCHRRDIVKYFEFLRSKVLWIC